MDKRINEGLARICEMFAETNGVENKDKGKFLKYAEVFRKLGNIQKKNKSKEVKDMGKRLTEQGKEDKEVKKILVKIHKLEKNHPQNLVERACYRYKMANLDKRRAEVKIKELEKELTNAKRRLK